MEKGHLPFHGIGTAAAVVHATVVNFPRPMCTVYVLGLCRFRVEKMVRTEPFPVAVVTQLDRIAASDDGENSELFQLMDDFRQKTAKVIGILDPRVPHIVNIKSILGSLSAHDLVDLCAASLNASFSEKLAILDAIDMSERLKILLPLLRRHLKQLENVRRIPVHSMIKEVKPVIHRINIKDSNAGNGGVMKVIDLLNKGNSNEELDELEKKLTESNMPPHAYKVAMKEFDRLKRSPGFSPDANVTRNYLELMAELPWSKSSEETIDIRKARQDLDADHYAMDKLKRRVLEYLAVRQLKNTLKGPILCFVGPPGVGKTSLGRSIARTLGREFFRISLGGVCNQADIRGHRRTYVGSLPGRIIHGIRTVGTNNPVFLLDEVDKLGSGSHGDPAAALLEVLDPEQNCSFVDHYLNVPFDLSQVMFIATANTTKSIPPALLDRLEVIHVPGYTQDEKLYIAVRHLLPKQLEAHGLNKDQMELPEESIKILISGYTREAGVRNLERKVCSLCRAVAVQVAEMSYSDKEQDLPIVLDTAALEEILGPAPYSDAELWSRLGQPGVAVGLAWTAVGGEVLLVEASKMEGDGEVILTGHLGDVMKESARLALNWVRTSAARYGLKLDGEMLSQTDVHIHFPAGAVGKDGPSAGVTIAAALMSLFAGKALASDVAMTGEITLRGVVLPVGGIKDKVLAAHRAGIRRIILPKKCEKDLHEVPDNIKNDLIFIFVDHVDEVLQAAFEGGLPGDSSFEMPPLRSKL
ncbi:lon protease homolog 2, peroxisomal isoform X2 [Anabrus simplex]